VKSCILLTNASDLAIYFARAVAPRVPLAAAVVEDRTLKAPEQARAGGGSLWSRLQRRAQRVLYGPSTAVERLGQRPSQGLPTGAALRSAPATPAPGVVPTPGITIALSRAIAELEDRQDRAARDRFLPGFDDAARAGFPCPTIRTASVNSPESVALLTRLRPDLLIVLGTSIIKPAVLAIPPVGTANIHGSILPRYRGTGAEFWQLYRDDFDSTGVTIHLVDAQVDTGPILAQQKTPVTPEDDFFTLRYRNIAAAIDLLPRVVEELFAGAARPTPQPPTAEPAYRASMITLEHKRELYQRKGWLKET
jgi:folate-dependent phosphoribosylglycinamide formyltransferase PurN